MGTPAVDTSMHVPERGEDGFAEFWQIWDGERAQRDVELQHFAAQIPAFAAVMASLDPEIQRAQAEHSRQLEQQAFVENEWQGLRENLITQGETYAAMGIPVADWQRLLGAVRAFMRREIERRHPDDPAARLRLSLDTDRYLDWAMGVLGASYVSQRQRLVDQATGTLDLFRDLFDRASVGMQILSAPDKDSDTWQVVAANRVSVAEDIDLLDLLDNLQHVQATGCAHEWEVSDVDKAGVPRFLTLRAFTLSQRHVGVLSEDISARRRLELARKRALEHLARSNQELDHFAYVASHDLRAPLRDVDNLASWIEEDALDHLPDDSRRHFAQLRARILRMERLLDDLLQYSRVGRFHLDAERIDGRAVIDAAVEQVGVPPEFTVEIGTDSVELLTPRVPLEQVLRNLIDNAFKHHGSSSGRVEIGHRPLENPDLLEFWVADDGVGIAPEYHERIFAMFQTLAPRDDTEGSGMGLALVKKIVEQHGGTMSVESSPGRGSTFRFTWPREWQRPAIEMELETQMEAAK